MDNIALAFFWHQHQPYYPDDVAGENPMPWVRLHGTKDYWGMAMLLKEVPEMRATINLVPSLIKQLRAYTDEGREDTHLRVSRLPADGLSEQDMYYLLDNFFMVHPDHMIRPYPRYYELYQQRGLSIDSAAQAAKRFSKRDILDLQCWSNLTWMHPLVFEKDSELAEFRRKGQHWTEAEKLWLLERQKAILAEVIPLHRKLQQQGQVELTTTPFYHPILPLLWDRRLARQAMPDVHLPQILDPYPEDAIEQIRRGVAYHTEVFGKAPRGMWPSEGSVCQGMIPAVAAAGIKWLATDEEILSRSTDGWVSREAQGFLRNPEMLYRPWRLEEKGASLQAVFRDHAMSDQIGFHYQRFPAQQAVDDMFGKLEGISRATSGKMGGQPTLVPIILDGENCWEYFADGGVGFLRTLYRSVAKHPQIKPVRLSDHLEKHPAKDKIGHLFPGSWISHNFGIWIGHHECNRAWDLLAETREHLVGVQAAKTHTPAQLARAWEELYIAEGSDWFWWFGDSHSSAQDDLFDRLFRKHLQNVYLALEETPPTELLRAISQGGRSQAPYTAPTGLLNVRINGRQTYFEWLNAGRFVSSGARGTMTRTDASRLKCLYFGFDTESLLLRFDSEGGPVREQFADLDTLRITFVKPEGYELLVSRPAWREPILQLYHQDVPVVESGIKAAADAILEIAIPWRTLAANVEDAVQFFVEFIRGEQTVERAPSEGAVETLVPSPEFELMMWQA